MGKINSIGIIGDSISTFSGWIPSGYATHYPKDNVTTVDMTWWYKVAIALGLNPSTQVSNCSWSGSKVTGNSASTSSASAACSTRRITDIANFRLGGNAPDVVLCYISCNDWGSSVALGDWTIDDGRPQDSTNVETASDAYALMLYKLKEHYPSATIFCLTNMEDYQRDSDKIAPSDHNGVTVEEWNTKIKEIATSLGCEIIDLHECMTYEQIASSEYSYDGTHPTAAGHALMADFITKTIKRQLLIMGFTQQKDGNFAMSHSDIVKVRGLRSLTEVLKDYVYHEENNDVVYPSTKLSGVIPQGGKWVSKSSRWSYMIPHTYHKGDVMIITANASQPASYAFLTSDSHVAGQDVDFANDATGWTSVAKNTTARIEIPSTCTFILIYEKWDATSVLPSSLKIHSFIPKVDEGLKEDVEELKQRPVVSLYESVGINTDGAVTQKFLTEMLYKKVSLDISGFDIVKCNIYNGVWNDVGSSARKTIFVPLEDGHTYTLIASATCYYALVTSTNVVANQTPAFVDGYTDKRTLSAGGTVTIEGVTGQWLWVRDDVLSFQIEVASDAYMGFLSKDNEIVDGLDSDDSEKVLSARQGKVLNDNINAFGNVVGEMPNIFHLGTVVLGQKQASTWALSKNFENGTITFHCNSADASVYAWMDFSFFPFLAGRKYRLEFDYASTTSNGAIYFSNQHANISNVQWNKTFGVGNGHISQDFTFQSGYVYLFTTAAGTGAGKEMIFSNIKITELSALPLLANAVRNISDVDAATHICEYTGQPFPRPTNRIGFSRYMPVHTTGGQGWYMQGCAAYGKWLFDIDEGFDRINVYDLEKREFHSQVTREATGHHCNTAMFTNIFLDDGDDFPLLLVSGTSGDPAVSYLCKVTFVNDVFTIEIIQTITYPSSLGGQLKIDNNRGFYWACGISSFRRFAIPAIKDGNGDIIPTASLSSEDVLETLTVTYNVSLASMQGGIIVNGWHYCGFGVPSWGNKIYFVAVSLYDANTEPIVINLTDVYHPTNDDYEPEGVFVYDGHLFISFKNYGFVKVHI